MAEVEKSLHGDKSGQGFSGPKERFVHCSDLGRSPTELRVSSQHKRHFFYLFPDPSVALRTCQRPHVGDIGVEVENRVLCSHLRSHGVTPTHGPQMWAFRKHWDQAKVCNQLLEELPCSCSPVWTPESQPILFALQSLTFFNWLFPLQEAPSLLLLPGPPERVQCIVTCTRVVASSSSGQATKDDYVDMKLFEYVTFPTLICKSNLFKGFFSNVIISLS